MSCTHAIARLSPGGCLLCPPDPVAPIAIVSAGDGEERDRIAVRNDENRQPSDRLNATQTVDFSHAARAVKSDSPVGGTVNNSVVGASHAAEITHPPGKVNTEFNFERREEIAAELQETISRLNREKARRSLYQFLCDGWEVLEPGTPLEKNWHIEAICFAVQQMLMGWLVANQHAPEWMRKRVFNSWALHNLAPQLDRLLVQNLVINVPPGTLKSRILMVFAPAWVWLHWPQWSVYAVSGNSDNVKRDSDECRKLVTSDWYRETFGVTWTIRTDMDGVEKWETTAGGKRRSRGLETRHTGIHVDAILLDDPDTADDVWSEPKRRRVHNKWLRELKNRVASMAKSIRIAIQQRLHVDDWTGHVTNRSVWSPKKLTGWARMVLPMEYGYGPANDNTLNPWGWTDPRNAKGEVLHPARFPAEVLEDERLDKGPQGYNAQYNQNPESEAAGMFKRPHFGWCRLIDDPEDIKRPEGCQKNPAFVIERDRKGKLQVDDLVLSADCTFGSTADTASAVSLLIIAAIGARRCVLDDVSKPMGFHDTVNAIRALVAKWGVSRVIVEKKANGASVIEELTRLLGNGDLLGPDGKSIIVTIEDENPGSDSKIARANAMAPMFAAGLLMVRQGQDWTDAYVTELSVFPHGKRDDRVDSTSQAVKRMATGSVSAAVRKLMAMRGVPGRG